MPTISISSVGASPNFDAKGEIMYAKIDNSNNIVACIRHDLDNFA
jgi:hypothetical protein